MHVPNKFIVLVVEFKAMTEVSGSQSVGYTTRIVQHDSERICIGIKAWGTKIPTILLQNEMFTVVNAD